MSLSQCLLLAALFTIVNGDVVTSGYKLQKMALSEDRILSELKQYLEEQQNLVKVLSKAYTTLTQGPTVKQESDGLYDLNHPNGLYYVIKRFSVQYYNLLGMSLGTLRDRLKTDGESIPLAGGEDFEGALRGLLRLQKVYNLTVPDMVQGTYRGHRGPALGFEDAFSIGRIAFIDAEMHQVEPWLRAAVELRKKDPAVATNPRKVPTEASIKALLGRAYVLLEKFQKAEDIYQEAYADDQNNGEVKALKRELKERPKVHVTPTSEAQANYSRLCQHQGPFHIESPDYKAMKCRYKPGLVPYNAFKEEILSISPYVSLFYNVTTETQRKHLMENVYAKMERGTVGSGIATEKLTTSKFRTSDVAWLSDFQNASLASLSWRISLVTGLAVTYMNNKAKHPRSSEDFQIVNYGLAGHYDIHLDPFKIDDGSGYRIATFLIYLNDVVAGGNTVFTKAGISVSPDKDTVLFWYSFPPAFDHIDDMTHHAGCPVMIGQKWIANKWIKSYGNSYRRPCGLKPNQTQLDIERTMRRNQRYLFATLKS